MPATIFISLILSAIFIGILIKVIYKQKNPEQIEINFIEEDILNCGDYEDNKNCLLSTALKRITSSKNVSSGSRTFRVDDSRYSIPIENSRNITDSYYENNKLPDSFIAKRIY